MPMPFRTALRRWLDLSGKSLRQVAAESGVSYEQLKKMLQREDASTNFDDGVRVAQAFGVSVDEFLGDPSIRLRTELLRLFQQLSPEEQEFLLDVARVRSARLRPED
ncbi:MULTISPECIES: helix-turn-helix domain-containing protein [unclassified Paracoccus (in: a-proteobacteria)]|uniref:helix-turn-helix domain-containing protein n=1 Tax=unclassified Paracoccus (in: a-proteobacteria) TaxID=2688777 RepID=UPI0012B1B0B9|nr:MULTISPECIES: helix-turn-helix transcriptional regulator [unclassified Paracoccus (in: a-proteobacteria)]UXU75531.1 helix-turn-helix domain-containing protein [Paracoccus sp. SMMA_5]UXU81436.1 helix-turn-helix domain-containing protein [Paracoccus sp. SMMA_5_TC]